MTTGACGTARVFEFAIELAGVPVALRSMEPLTNTGLYSRSSKQEVTLKPLFAAAALALLSSPALAAPVSNQASYHAGSNYTPVQFRVEVDRDRDGWRDRDDWRRRREWREHREWRGDREDRCRVTIIRRDDGSVRRIRRCW